MKHKQSEKGKMLNAHKLQNWNTQMYKTIKKRPKERCKLQIIILNSFNVSL